MNEEFWVDHRGQIIPISAFSESSSLHTEVGIVTAEYQKFSTLKLTLAKEIHEYSELMASGVSCDTGDEFCYNPVQLNAVGLPLVMVGTIIEPVLIVGGAIFVVSDITWWIAKCEFKSMFGSRCSWI